MPSPAGAALLAFPRAGSGVGLHRVRWLVDESARDRPSGPPCIKIVGSKGKGSTAAMVHAILQQLLPCGLFVSPHLEEVEERFWIGDAIVTPAALGESVDWVCRTFARRPEWMATEHLGFFEAATAAAWRLFSTAQLQAAVVEAGIGGRLDSTRVLPGALAGLTSVELEHTALLGPTIDHIAFDKADICPPGGTLIARPAGTPLDARLQIFCDLRQIDLRWSTDVARATEIDLRPDGTAMLVDTAAGTIRDVWLPLPGSHQVSNAQCAIALALTWAGDRYDWNTLAEAIGRGLRRVRCPGRFERIASDPDVFIDVCHTPESAAASARAVRECLRSSDIVLVLGASFDKDVEPIAEALVPIAGVIVCTAAYHKGAPVARVVSAVRAANPHAEVLAAETIADALHLARNIASARARPVLVAGGLFLAIEARAVLKGSDPRALRFF